MKKREPNEEVIGALAAAVGAVFSDGWLVMLAFGVLHASAHAVPAFGYWQSVFVSVVARGIVGSGTAAIHRRVKKLVLR